MVGRPRSRLFRSFWSERSCRRDLDSQWQSSHELRHQDRRRGARYNEQGWFFLVAGSRPPARSGCVGRGGATLLSLYFFVYTRSPTAEGDGTGGYFKSGSSLGKPNRRQHDGGTGDCARTRCVLCARATFFFMDVQTPSRCALIGADRKRERTPSEHMDGGIRPPDAQVQPSGGDITDIASIAKDLLSSHKSETSHDAPLGPDRLRSSWWEGVAEQR